MSSDDPIVRLNVGGRHFDSFRSTLTRSPFFARMLDGTMSEPNLDTDGRIFLDRDPDGFAAVLRYLRTGMTKELDAIERESFEYFGLEVWEEAEAEPEKEDSKKIVFAHLPGFQEVAQDLGRQIVTLRDHGLGKKIERMAAVPKAAEPAWRKSFYPAPIGFRQKGTLDDADLTAALNAILDLDRFSLATANLISTELWLHVRVTLQFPF